MPRSNPPDRSDPGDGTNGWYSQEWLFRHAIDVDELDRCVVVAYLRSEEVALQIFEHVMRSSAARHIDPRGSVVEPVYSANSGFMARFFIPSYAMLNALDPRVLEVSKVIEGALHFDDVLPGIRKS